MASHGRLDYHPARPREGAAIYSIRQGMPEDADVIADGIVEAGDGIFEHLLDGLLPGIGAGDLIRMAVVDPDSCFNYRNALMAERDGGLCGLLLGYPAEAYGLPATARAFIPPKRLKPVQPLLDSRIPGSWYVNTVLIAPEHRGRGVGRRLLQAATGIARGGGAECLSLHVWADNEPIVAVCARAGFEQTAVIEVPKTGRLRHGGQMLLMRAPMPPAVPFPL